MGEGRRQCTHEVGDSACACRLGLTAHAHKSKKITRGVAGARGRVDAQNLLNTIEAQVKDRNVWGGGRNKKRTGGANRAERMQGAYCAYIWNRDWDRSLRDRHPKGTDQTGERERLEPRKRKPGLSIVRTLTHYQVLQN